MGKYLLFVLFCFGSVSSWSQCNHILHGIVLSAQGEPLPNATISIPLLNKNMVTSVDGSFRVSDLCEGALELRVSFVGYEQQVVHTEIPSTKVLRVTMSDDQTILKDVVIEGEQVAKQTSQTVSVLSKADLSVSHGKPLGESLKELPGVSALQTGPAIFKPVIHGLHSQRILILNNGIRQEGQQWGVEHAPEVDPYIASQIEVVKGAETVRYGADALGGVIIINTLPLHHTEQLGGEINFGVISNSRMAVFSGMLEGGIKKIKNSGWRIQSSVKRGGDFHSPDYNLSNTGVEEINFSSAFGLERNDAAIELYLSSFNTTIGILRAAHTGNLRDLQQSIVSGKPWYTSEFSYDINNPKQQINHHLLKVKAQKRVAEIGKINFLYGGQYNKRAEFDIRRGGRNTKPALQMGLISNVVDISLDHEKANHSGSLGINGGVKINRNDTEETQIAPLIPDFDQVSAGIFLSEKWKRSSWILEAGGRYDYQYLLVKTFQQDELIKPSFQFHFFSGTLGATYFVNQNTRIVNNFGISSRPPHVSELYSQGLHHGTASIEEGIMRPGGEVLTDDALIKKEISKKLVTTFQKTTEKINVDFSLYLNDIQNYVYIRPYETRLTIRGYFPVFRHEQVHALLAGSDIALKWKMDSRFNSIIKGSYVYARDIDHKDVLPYIPPAQIEYALSYTVQSLRKLQDVFISVGLPYTFRQNFAPRVVYPEDIPSDSQEGIFDFAPAPSSYFLINAQAGFTIPVKAHPLSVSLSADNLMNVKYRNYMNRLRYYADETGRNLTLRLTYNFLKH